MHATRAAGEAHEEVFLPDKRHVVVSVAYGAGRFGGEQRNEQSRGGDVFCAAHLTLREVDAELALTPGLRCAASRRASSTATNPPRPRDYRAGSAA